MNPSLVSPRVMGVYVSEGMRRTGVAGGGGVRVGLDV